MEFNGKAAYSVAVKVILRDGDKILLTHDIWNTWELPGGRIRVDEFQKDLAEVVRRKLGEELGNDIKYSDLKPTGTFFQVSRIEETGDLSEKEVKIFAIGYEAKFDGGVITIGDSHDKFEWFDINELDPLELQDNDWMRGLQDYLDKIRSKND